jgi:hypothetical protein
MSLPPVLRRTFLKSAICTVGTSRIPGWYEFHEATAEPSTVLSEFPYGDVDLHSRLHETQLNHQLELLLSLNEDSLMKPFRQMAGLPARGEDLGGWYSYNPGHDGTDGAYAPTATFGQWVSALARIYAIRRSPEIRDKVMKLNRLSAQVINGQYFKNNRFPTYCHDKLVCGLMDSHSLAQDPDALRILRQITDAALPHMPGKAVDSSDESYTASENLFLAYQRGAGERYKQLGMQYLADYYYDPLSEGKDNFAGRHAYSYINSLSSAAQAYLTLGSRKHLQAARNGFDLLTKQSYATGGWGPDETLQAAGSNDLLTSLTKSHHSFETPCGTYAHFKLTRYLLRITREARYGDSMERVMYNTVLGALPTQPDGRTFYYADCNFEGRKIYSSRLWPCCSGTLPQVAADYRICSYFRAKQDGLIKRQDVFINLYIPSTVRWIQNGSLVSLAQKSAYPTDGNIRFELTLSKPAEFTLNWRIPQWAEGATIAVNGKRAPIEMVPRSFARLGREWKNGDRIDLELPMRMRLESLDSRQPRTVALMRGPLVLFPITKSAAKTTRAQLLTAAKTEPGRWLTANAQEPIEFAPFTEIKDEAYSTYMDVID